MTAPGPAFASIYPSFPSAWLMHSASLFRHAHGLCSWETPGYKNKDISCFRQRGLGGVDGTTVTNSTSSASQQHPLSHRGHSRNQRCSHRIAPSLSRCQTCRTLMTMTTKNEAVLDAKSQGIKLSCHTHLRSYIG